jgi:hypothetical protein
MREVKQKNINPILNHVKVNLDHIVHKILGLVDKP